MQTSRDSLARATLMRSSVFSPMTEADAAVALPGLVATIATALSCLRDLS